MSDSFARRIAAIGTVLVMTSSSLLLAPPADAARLMCRASMSDPTPAQHSNTYVRVKTAPRAKVRTVAHYRTTDTVYHRKANKKGRARIRYYTASATPGYRVWVDVRVRKNGRQNTCRTSFVPHR